MNPKHEIRNPKQIKNSKFKLSKHAISNFGNLKIRYCFEFRDSIFEFSVKLSVYSLKKILYEGDAKSINCQTIGGEVTILDKHRPFVSTLKEGVIRILDGENKAHYVNAKSGFVEVMPTNEVRFIVEER
ncbi:MAG: hypothetical protein COT61_02200 [Candidatus Portnoybacteria bacterium CG09_land_8_20_14_0_10_44_13]|uniref:ATP synthase F1 complex delta/epsilon subunit N-terminal domain-containing protein n=4 Tax=Candidatus Portnoyibacteriota TaxID=1817913 RepID=A0A2H0KQ34_9BACT|nr:MAG: hypothetical protein COV85_03210 [Candidatus Portnoybacteria bacterium CG11_big_fil_rev_8_21_14_0_20_44_10]PIS16777.1 MAG: hypothetical protein COT61_02200 [Candidatus Portnoybacteria bacterium CG09_land_8_20_14_0_10_44_13]PIZ71869.1 MAG: hypothetical protein COY11_00740 [Candidatus Portnoybacteria bacterium CG_4_10_14_0_2_um_filter_44_20]PJA63416.1 MAG: hypothetical protein CO161_01150 [Candidatus Portnoybacteria bacterium CG_4_9_14_3_um_filter_44_9]